MIDISVVAYNGGATAPLKAQFDELGGNIGRADNNQLVLPDPERTISRVHAQVVFRSGRYAIVDRGSNPISVNGRTLGSGQEAPIQPGDELQIGGYTMRVEAGTGSGVAAPADPFADFAGLASTPAAAPSAGRAQPGAFADPLAGFAGAAPPARPGGSGASHHAPPPAAGGIPADWNPFAPDAATSPRTADPLRGAGASGGSFGLEVAGRTDPLIPEFAPGAGSGGGDSLDALFGLGVSGGGADPLAGSVLNPAAAQPNMAANADPLKSLNSVTRGTASAAPDRTPELSAPFQVPPMRPPPARPAPPVAQPVASPVASSPPPAANRASVAAPVAPVAPPATFIPPTSFHSGFSPPAAPAPPAAAPQRPSASPSARSSPAERAAPPGAVLSWNEPSGESRTTIRARRGLAPTGAPSTEPLDLSLDFDAPPPPAVPAPPSPAAPAARAAPAVMAPPSAPPAPASARQAPATPAARPVPGADVAALTAALREGLGVASLPPESLVLTPALMHLMGRLVHEAARGTVELLVARAALKREIRAEVTMIVARENNPLKFSPSVDVALGHLLQPPVRGFMPADKAMRDAYDDLRAHQFGFLAGMRAALEGILKRFDPAVLEGKLTQKSMLSSLLPAKRKARMWDVFTDLYGQISAEATDDFHELFGKEFLRAYNEYIDQLDADRP